MSTNSKIKTYRNYDEIPKAFNPEKHEKRKAIYTFLQQFYGFETLTTV